MDLITPDSGLIFWQILIFLSVLFVLGKFAWKPMLNALDERENSIQEALLAADRARNEMSALKADNEKLLAEARRERDNILKDATAAANKLREEAREQAAKDSARIVEDARASIETQKKAALAEVKKQVAELSVEIAEKILREQLSNDQAQKAYVAKLVKDINVN
ncbi:MAG: F0F1 ATP synthase subunit B [Cyclobacteriaceae bacterium]